MDRKVLFILHLPPPVHGSAMMGQYIKDSILIDSVFDAKFINLSTSIEMNEIGRKSIIKISRYIKIIFKILSAIISFQPDIVYLAITAKGIGFYKDLPIAVLAKLFRKKLVLHYHNKGVSNYQHRFLDHCLYKILFKNSKVILLSQNLFKDISKYVVKEDVFFCPNGIPDVNDLMKKTSKKNDIFQILFLSNLIETKGVYVLLEALNSLKNYGLKFHCNLVGGEGDISINQLNYMIENSNLENCVTYLGKKYGQDKYDVFHSSDLFVLPTYYHNECFPLVLLEAMMFELPVISTNEGGIADIVKLNKTGLIIKQNNPRALAERIKQLFENPKQTKQMGEHGRNRFLENYTLEVFENRLVNILNQI